LLALDVLTRTSIASTEEANQMQRTDASDADKPVDVKELKDEDQDELLSFEVELSSGTPTPRSGSSSGRW
jgi:hypothetical protein